MGLFEKQVHLVLAHNTWLKELKVQVHRRVHNGIQPFDIVLIWPDTKNLKAGSLVVEIDDTSHYYN